MEKPKIFLIEDPWDKLGKPRSIFYRIYYKIHYLILEAPRDIYLHVKWAYQRVVRGWDDRVYWSLDTYLSDNIPVWLMKVKSYPGNPAGISEEEWRAIIDTIIEGFEAANRISDLYYYRADPPLTYEEAQKTEEEDKEKFKKGMKLLTEYYFDLWT